MPGESVKNSLASAGGTQSRMQYHYWVADTISTITAVFPPGAAVTTQRSVVMYIVTEYGIADVFCKPIPDRVKALIAIAHPDFRYDLKK